MYYNIRVLLDTEIDVFRDIEISAEASFEELHRSILKAFGWEPNQMASFYESNEKWDRGREIPLIDIDEEFGPEKLRTMAEVKLKEVISEPSQKLLYVFDFMLMWCFYVEVEGIYPDGDLSDPRVVRSVGTPPSQTDKEPVDFRGQDPILAHLPEDDEDEDSEDDEDGMGDEFSDFGEDDYR
jgi:hypothetical protein